MSATALVLGAVLAVELALVAGLVATLAVERFRMWPPPSGRSWQFHATWILFVVAFAGLMALGLLTWGDLGIPTWRRVVGGVLFVAGNVLAFAGAGQIGVRETFGLEGELNTGGLYRWTRNPQYLGDLVLLLGWTLLVASLEVLVASALLSVWFVLAPRAEEPWLEEQYGEAYRRYKSSVPRFL